jgi:signal transduction histidine kinase
MFKSIYFKYFIIFCVVLFSSYILLGGLLFYIISNYTISEKKELLTSSVKDVSALYSSTINNSKIYEQRFRISHEISTISSVIGANIFITDDKGTYLTCSDQNSKTGSNEFNCVHKRIVFPKDILDAALTEEGYSGTCKFNYSDSYSISRYVVAVPITLNDGSVIGIVFADTELSAISDFTKHLVKIFTISVLVILPFTFIIIYFITYKMVRPLKLMSVAAKKMGEGDFSTKIPVTSYDEIGQLAIAFNNMSASLASLETMRRSFVANVSHEFKTPMTTIAGFIDGILDGTIPKSEQSKYLKIVSDETKRLSRMVKTLLNLSRVDAGELKLNYSEFDFREKILQVILSFEKNIEDKHLEIKGLDSLEKHNIYADSDLITHIIYNLIDNAIKFSNENGEIDISVKSENNNVYFKIRNTGEGISEKDIPHIFERFYKTDKSRSIDKNGTGLGLFIAKSIIDLHNGTILVRSTEGEFCEFEFSIPENIKNIKNDKN